MKKNLAFLFLMTIFLVACAGANTASLKNTSWELVSYGAKDNPTSALAGVETAITFDGDGNLNGNVGCNRFFGPYKLSGDALEVGPVGATEMYCEETWEQEMAVLTILNGTLSFDHAGDTLNIFSADGKETIQLHQIQN